MRIRQFSSAWDFEKHQIIYENETYDTRFVAEKEPTAQDFHIIDQLGAGGNFQLFSDEVILYSFLT